MIFSNLEVLVGMVDGEVRRFWRDNSVAAEPWDGPGDGFAAVPLTHVSLINSSYGNLEAVIVRPGGFLEHYYRDSSGNWHFGATIPIPQNFGQAAGPPSFIQRQFPTTPGKQPDFEVLVPSIGQNVMHFTRHNDQNGLPWDFDAESGFGISVLSVALIESDYGPYDPGSLVPTKPGNLECVLVSEDDAALWHFYRNPANGVWENSTWDQARAPITSRSRAGLSDGRLQNPGAYAGVGFVQHDLRIPWGASEPHANFEVVVTTPAGTLAHYYRDNSPGSEKWFATEEFGQGNYPALIKRDDSQSLEVVAGGNDQGLIHFRRDIGGGNWSQTATFAGNNAGGALGFLADAFIPPITP